MAPTKTITIYGAAGRQGESVVRSLLANKSNEFCVRCLTSDANSDKAKEFASKGAEVLEVHPTSPKFQGDLRQALEGSWGLYINVDSINPLFAEDGILQESVFTKSMVDIAREAGVEHIVYSSLPDIAKHSDDLISIRHFQQKSLVAAYVKKAGFATATVVSPGWYLENYLDERLSPVIGGFPFTADQEGYYTLQTPTFGSDNAGHYLSIKEDYGDIVHGIFVDPEATNGSTVQALSAPMTPTDIVTAFTSATGKPARFNAIPVKEFQTYGVAGLMSLKKEFLFCAYTGGHFYGDATDRTAAAQLKEKGLKARGEVDSHGLTSAETFFRRYFS